MTRILDKFNSWDFHGIPYENMRLPLHFHDISYENDEISIESCVIFDQTVVKETWENLCPIFYRVINYTTYILLVREYPNYELWTKWLQTFSTIWNFSELFGEMWIEMDLKLKWILFFSIFFYKDLSEIEGESAFQKFCLHL